MSKYKSFSIGHSLVGSTNLAIGVAKQQDRVDRMVSEENHNLVEEEEGERAEEKCYKKGESIALAPALICSGKLARDVVDEASRLKATKRAVYRRARSSISIKPAYRSRLPSSGLTIQLPHSYQKVRQISNGSYSAVSIVVERGTEGPLLAAKTVQDTTLEGSPEAELLRRLQECEHVPKLVAVVHSHLQTIIITEHLGGGNLFERLSQPNYSLTEEKCRLLVTQVLQGLSFLHREGVVHLNLMPYNLIFSNLNSDHGLKIIDFGHAVEVAAGEPGHKLKNLQGTVEYSSPEVLTCGIVSFSSDMFSLGIVLYTLLSGGLSPFYSTSRVKTFGRVLNCQYDLEVAQLAGTSPQGLQLLQHLLVREPALRLSAVQALQHPWLLHGKSTEEPQRQIVVELETGWMKRCLARRRWQRALNTLRAVSTIRRLSSAEYRSSPGAKSRRASERCLRLEQFSKSLGEPGELDEFQERYQVERQIGSGSFGHVFLVKDTATGELAAAKYQKQEVRKVRAEVAMLSALIQSAFVVQLVGFYEGPLNSVLVTEYLAGGDLITRTAPDDYCLTERKCQIFIRQIVRGIQFIHSQRILHLDIKPFNVVFVHPESDHDLRIIDFGIAQELKENEDKIPIAMSGTLEYMSPEVMDCKHASPASDMWSLGATAFQLLSGGVAPFWAGNKYRTMARTIKCQFDFSSPNFQLVSPTAIDFIRKLLVLEPEKRLSACLALSHPWLTGAGQGLSEREHWSTLETAWMRGVLARRRWFRWYRAIVATLRIRRLSMTSRQNEPIYRIRQEHMSETECLSRISQER